MANYALMIPWIQKWEGGLSKAKTDSASADPVPDGSGYHTNKGITWTTFKSMAPKIGYTPTPNLFYKMPQDIWGKIFKSGYWDAIKGDSIKSQSVAEILADWAWGAGPGTAVKKFKEFMKLPVSSTMDANTLALLNRVTDEKTFVKSLSDFKLKWYTSLPNQSANYAGWTNRLNDLYNVALTKLGPVGTVVALSGTTLLIMVIIGILILSNK
jgi:lysozyme family protein